VALVAALITGVVTASPAVADDTGGSAQPATSDEAKAAWLAAAQSGDQLNQNVLTAQEQVADAQNAATAAQASADALVANVTAADAQVLAAQAKVDSYRPALDAVANASLKGAQLGQLSALFVSDSADDYLDRSTALDQVATETLETMSAARAAKDSADAAKADAETAHATAQQAADAAAAALVAAQQAEADATVAQSALGAQILQYEQAYSALSASERGQAIEEFANSNLSPEAQARLAEQAAQRAAAGITDDVIAGDDISDLSVSAAPDVLGGIAVAAALTRRGLSYVWGATGPDSFDCSGLMLWAWQQAGIAIPRTSAEQSTLPEVPLDELQAGDLVTFYSPVSHVGMYVGNGLVIHASMPGVPITVVPLDKAGPNASGHHVPR